MGLKLSEEWQTFVHNSKLVADADFVSQSLDDLGEKAVSKMQEYGQEYNWNESFSASFIHRVDSGRAGFGTTFTVSFYNDETHHGKFVLEGTSGSPYSGPPPSDLVSWVIEKLGKEPSAAYPIAKTIIATGTQVSERSVLRGLPPEGQKGYDPILHIEANGDMEELMNEVAIGANRRIKRIFGV